MATMQVEHCFPCAHHHYRHMTDRDRSLRTVILANEIRKRKRQTIDAPLMLVATAAAAAPAPTPLPPVVAMPAHKRQRTLHDVVEEAHSTPARQTCEEKEGAKRKERRLRMKEGRVASTSSRRLGTKPAPIVLDDEVIASGHIRWAVNEALCHREQVQLQIKNAVAAAFSGLPGTNEMSATTNRRQEARVYDLYFSRESLNAIVNLVSEWIRRYDQSAYESFTPEAREKWIISLIQMIVQILNWRLNNFFSSYSHSFKIEAFPNLFSKNFKADTSSIGIDKLAKKWQKRNYELLLATLIYADRYVCACGLNDLPLFHLLAISSLCTIKHWLEERNRHANRLFAEVLSLSVKQVNNLERVFLGGLGYSLSLSPEDFPQFLLARMAPNGH